MSDILLWGAGNTSKLFIRLIDMRKNRILGIVDNKAEGYFGDYAIVSPEEALKISYDLLIVCSIADVEILWQCHELGLEHCYSYQDKEDIFYRCPDLFIDPNGVIEHERQYKRDVKLRSLSMEQLWSNVFHDTVSAYDWFKVKSLSLGRSAIGYNFAYVMSRILQSMHPKNILELGLGQSSKILNSYFQYYKKEGMVYDIVEHDHSWADFFREEVSMEDVGLHFNEISMCQEYNDQFYRYEDLDEVLEGKRYHFISIDAPFGYKGNYIGRTDLIKYIPNILEDDWVIMLDDYERIQEKNAMLLLERQLKKEYVTYHKGIYNGQKDVCILTSENWKFLITL